MAIYHLSVKTISRSAGRTATAAAAYRSGDKIADERTGEIHDYTRKSGVLSADLIAPQNAPSWASDRSKVWNAAEAAETRKNSTVAREFEIALPSELSAKDQQQLAHDFAREIVERHGCIADVAIHEPNKNGDDRNYHAHILLSTRVLDENGFGKKTRELDDKTTGSALVTAWRERFATLTNERLSASGSHARVDHRSLDAQDIDRAPSRHHGPTATAIERRRPYSSTKISNSRDEQFKHSMSRLDQKREEGRLPSKITEAKKTVVSAEQAILEWRSSNKLQSNLHDKGIQSSEKLNSLHETKINAGNELAALQIKWYEAQRFNKASKKTNDGERFSSLKKLAEREPKLEPKP
ncbi:MAG: MobQ family relaxase, partial [Plesiomonas sp.]|uniref:MobQ family relaxase n=1 Tax=Plesiomonas sp. TaxID=2486279 RepID=UPI003F2A274F